MIQNEFEPDDKVIVFVFSQVYYDCSINEVLSDGRYDIEFPHGGCSVYPAKSVYRDTARNREVFKRFEDHQKESNDKVELILRGLDFEY